MKLAISNIAWDKQQDETMYRYLSDQGFCGLEIAPTRLWEMPVYERGGEAARFAHRLAGEYSLSICSMQSIWFGRSERLFGPEEERLALLEYTKRAIDFAVCCQCENLVFGCPRNRVIGGAEQYDIAVGFFHELGEYACAHGTVLSIEANPPIYHTNFINRTAEAFQLARDVSSRGFRVNLDMGTMLENREPCHALRGYIPWINHVHISEPGLAPIQNRPEHMELASVLRDAGYDRYLSIEMKNTDDMGLIRQAAGYVRTVFGG